MKKALNIIIILLAILLLVGGVYWYLFLRVPAGQVSVVPGNQTTSSNGFVPLNRNVPAQTPLGNYNASSTQSGINGSNTNSSPLVTLRELSTTPVGGFGLFTSTPLHSTQTGTTTMRWVDRGRGNIYEAYGDKSDIVTISNTLVPRIYQSWWNKGLTSFFAQYSSASSDSVTTVIANIIRNSATTASTSQDQQTTETPFALKGSLVSGNVIAVAVSPAKDKAIIVMNSNDRSIGYTSKFDGSGQTQLFNIPLTQITVDWPETNTIAITTKASASYAGYLYLVNVKTGAMKQVLGGIAGLSAKVSRDASKILYSSTGTGNTAINTAILDLKTGKTTDVVFKTLGEKCVWSAEFVENVYCAVPSQIPNATYPDDWYLGNVSFNDNIWLLNTNTSNASQAANLLTLGNALIDAYNLQIDSIDNYLLFMNKNDLSLWSLDLVSSN